MQWPHSLGGFLNLAHGECNAILLGPASCNIIILHVRKKFQIIGEILGVSLQGLPEKIAAQELCQAIEIFRRKLGISNTLKDLGVNRGQLFQLVEHALQDACMATNPQLMAAKDVEAVYEQAL